MFQDLWEVSQKEKKGALILMNRAYASGRRRENRGGERGVTGPRIYRIVVRLDSIDTVALSQGVRPRFGGGVVGPAPRTM